MNEEQKQRLLAINPDADIDRAHNLINEYRIRYGKKYNDTYDLFMDQLLACERSLASKE